VKRATPIQLFWVVLCVCGLVADGPAATVTWDGSESGDWSVAANWVGGVAPVDGDDVEITGDGTAPTSLDIAGLSLGVLTFSNDFPTMTISGEDFSVNQINALRSSGDGAEHTNTFDVNVTMSQIISWTVNSSSELVFNKTLGESVSPWPIDAYGNGDIVLKGTNMFTGGLRNNQTEVEFYSDDNLGPAPGSPDPDFFRSGYGNWLISSTNGYSEVTIHSNRGMTLTANPWLRANDNVAVTYNGVITEDAAGRGLTINVGMAGWLILGGDSDFSGNLDIQGGQVILNHDNALGSGQAGSTISLYHTLDLNGHDMPTRDISSNNGQGYESRGMLVNTDTGTAVTVSGDWANGSTPGRMFGGPGDIIFTGDISGSNPLVKEGSGRVTLKGANTFDDYTSISCGECTLDYASDNGGKLADAQDLRLNHGKICLEGSSVAPTTETVGDLRLDGGHDGANAITIAAGTDQNCTLALDAITLDMIDTLDITLQDNGSGVAAVTTTDGDRALGGNSTFNESTWAKIVGGSIVGMGDGEFETNFATSDTNSHMEVSGTVTLGASATAQTLRFKNSGSTTLDIGSGQQLNLNGENGGLYCGILVTTNSGPVAITNGILHNGLNQTIHVHQYSTNPLTIASQVADYSAGNNIAKVGPGELVLSNTNNHFINASVYGGTLTFNSIEDGGTWSTLGGGSGQSIYLADATLKYVGTGHSSDRRILIRGPATIEAAGSGTLNFTSSGKTVETSHGSDHTLNLAGNGDGSLAGELDLSLGGVAKTGSGTWTLNGTNTYVGDTVVEEGRLDLGGEVARDVIVESGGTLGGSGTIGDDLIMAGALAISLTSNTVYDSFDVGGEATISGDLNVTLIGGYKPEQEMTYQIINADGGVTGSFSNITDGFVVTYETNGVVLGIAPPKGTVFIVQ